MCISEFNLLISALLSMYFMSMEGSVAMVVDLNCGYSHMDIYSKKRYEIDNASLGRGTLYLIVCTESGLFQMQKRKRLQSRLPTVKRHSLFASQGEPHDPGAAPHGQDHRPPQEGRAPGALVLLAPKARACRRSGLAFPPGPPWGAWRFSN